MLGKEAGSGGKVIFGRVTVGTVVGIGKLGRGGRVVFGAEGRLEIDPPVGKVGRVGLDPPVGMVGRVGINPPVGRVGRVGIDGIGGRAVGIVGTCSRLRAPRLTSALENSTTMETTRPQILENAISIRPPFRSEEIVFQILLAV
ncbi:hypothetical protein MLD38_026935 [Melastoma candidum]|uniref:Uncharacterized protein n=1 Tax=Melastoma candidum TaxID=119954 RepID=A0ACB9P045_9MYRT|nr:hypothetical protein MLD38_026935 [Melastoma candidum]